jgi:transcription-repair coupling factor (superfamily II helicase)
MNHAINTFSNSVNSTARLFFLKELFQHNNREWLIPRLIITDKDEDLSLMQNFASTVFGEEIYRIKNLSDLWSLSPEKDKTYTISHMLLENIGSIEYLKRHSIFTVKRWDTLKMEECIEILLWFWYTHRDHTGELSTYKREWSIISITNILWDLIQIEWFDTEIDNIIETSSLGKRSFREQVIIGNLNPDITKIVRNIWVLNNELLEHISSIFTDITLFWCDFLTYIEELRNFASIHFTDFHRENAIPFDVSIPSIEHIDEFLWFLQKKCDIWSSILIYTKFEKSVRDFLEFHQIIWAEIIGVSRFWIESFEITSEKWRLIIADDIIGKIFVKTRSRKSLAKNLDLLISLKPGDYVVHREHGIAKFDSVVKKTLWKPSLSSHETSQKRSNLDDVQSQKWVQRPISREVSREYLELHYAEWDKLFVPLTEIYRVSKYLGELEPELTRLTGKEWERAIEKADEEIEAIAQDIIETTAKRSIARGRAFWAFRMEEKKFQEAFAYDYTLDQTQVIDEVFGDMEKDEPMDRLLSGDVGFGKTEVAMNAIYKAILSWTQVAVISPLLVLADEHYETFMDRLGPFGVKVGIMTRMNSEKEIKQTLKDLKEWKIDVLVGTHRLLSDDIIWKKLGLLVIDEEHKFWVSHKEKIKKLRAGIDILSLSATPIPRSLNLALSGLRKISLLTTPPKKKKPIRTIISKWHEPTLKHAIAYELDRGGQIIILHNRIRWMEGVEKEIQNIIKSEERWYTINGETEGDKLFESVDKQKEWWAKANEFLSPSEPFVSFQLWKESKRNNHESTKKSRIIITHGQMPGDQIEDRIHAFKKHEYDILLTTTIIENGVNFLSANTIIILDPEDFGLASLHQLRGRVGRKDTEGFCYLVYRKPELGKDEKERLITIANNSHLGAGFEIAMRDLEIRGAWDMLGIKQSGKSKDIGLTLYFRMLEEKIEMLKSEKKTRLPVKVELDLPYTINDEAFLSEQDKLQFYRDIENIETLEELDEIQSEMPWAANLFLLLKTRIILSEYDVIRLSRSGINYVFDFTDTWDATRIRAFLDRFDKKSRMVLLSIKKIRVETRYWKSIEDFLCEITMR